MRELESHLDSDEDTQLLPAAYHHNGDSFDGSGINQQVLRISLIHNVINWMNMYPELHRELL